MTLPRPVRWRRFFAVTLALSLGLATWLRSPVAPPIHPQELALAPLALEPDCCTAGPLRLVGAWHLTSRNDLFGGYSALVQITPGRMLALSDRGNFMDFALPDGASGPVRIGPVLRDQSKLKDQRDIESATRDPLTGHLWIALEGRNAIARYSSGLDRQRFREVPEMKGWAQNTGPEAMVRLADGRFVVLCECNPGWFQGGLHPGLLFASDPSESIAAQTFTFAGVDGYRPTDIAQLPDGRVLILVRRLVWPVPARFAIKVLIADPAAIRPGKIWQGQEIADISAPWPVDNYEGLAIGRQADGKLIGWIISDENGAATQRALLLKVEIDAAKLPPKQRAPGSPDAP